jgi:hypothetical protein
MKNKIGKEGLVLVVVTLALPTRNRINCGAVVSSW